MEHDYCVQELAFQMGETLLVSGAEISRVQETMERVAKAYHAESFNAYVLTNAIFVNGREQGNESATLLKAQPDSHTHLGRICAVNQLSREITQGKYTVEEAFEILEKIKKLPYSPLPLAILACGVGSAAFSFLFGGNGWDALTAFICGLALEIFLHFAEKHNLSKFLTNLSSSAMVAILACVLTLLGLGNHLDKVIIGSIIRLVPGVALTTSIRDFFNRDYLSGAIRMLDAVLVGGCIAIGVGVVMRLMALVTGGALL